MKGKRILIVGGSSGIGKAVAEEAKRRGATVGVTYLSHYVEGGYQVDVTDEHSIKQALEGFCGPVSPPRPGFGLHGLLITAGMNLAGGVEEQTVKQFKRVVDVNLTGTYAVIHHAWRYMYDRGNIVTIGSLSGIYGGPWSVGYTAAKSGLHGLTKVLARNLAEMGVRVNCLAPGVILNEFTEMTMAPHVKPIAEQRHLLGFGKEADLVPQILLWLNGESPWQTGVTLSVDGGAHI